ncbi:MarR family transcriptional regulator [Kitasatospora sp. NPDC006697]|uniref:MarR family transcriptional regulator n=1 Tax=Kitasatospora sp. NPDC006697 TaxID=3364020 RepID=UPI00367C7711
MSSTPALNGQVIGRAHHATRALLERELARTGTSFQQSLALNATHAAGGEIAPEQLAGQLVAGLKIARPAAEAVVAELVAAGLLAPAEGGRLRLSETGTELGRSIREATAALVTRLYAGFPADQLETAARLLTAITERADAELAAAA